MQDNHKIFDRDIVRRWRERAAQHWPEHNRLKRELAAMLAERLEVIRRPFARALDIGCHAGEVAQALTEHAEQWFCADFAAGFARQPSAPAVVCDEEWLPFASASFDLIVSAFALHTVNDLPGALIQLRRVLKPGGLFVAQLPGERTLMELREAVVAASASYGFALSPRVSPFIGVREGAALLQRAGFAEPVADSECLTVEYEDVTTLFTDLHAMGEANALTTRRKGLTTPRQLAAIAGAYEKRGDIHPVSLDIVTLTGWG